MLIIVRHGRTPANASGELLGRRDPGLDEVGRHQAAAIGRTLAGAYRIVSSPLRRCRETAAAIGAPIQLDDRFIELDYGELEGVPVADVPAATWAAWQADTAWAPPGGESFDDLARRVGSALSGLIDDAAEQLKLVYKQLDKVAAKGTIHKNAASRKKSRLASQLNKAGAA